MQAEDHHVLYAGHEVAAFASQIKHVEVCGVVLEHGCPEFDWSAVETLTIRCTLEGTAISLESYAACAPRAVGLKVEECLRTTHDRRQMCALVQAMPSVQFVVIQDTTIDNLHALDLCRCFKTRTCARAVYLSMRGTGKLAPAMISLDGTPPGDLMHIFSVIMPMFFSALQ